MRKLIVLLLLAVLSGGAAAEWAKVGSTDNYDVYVDPTTFRNSGDKVKMWGLYELKNVQTIAGKKYLSDKWQREYDCKDERSRTLYFSWHSGNMGGGNVVYTDDEPGKWNPVPPGSIGETLWKLACGKQ